MNNAKEIDLLESKIKHLESSIYNKSAIIKRFKNNTANTNTDEYIKANKNVDSYLKDLQIRINKETEELKELKKELKKLQNEKVSYVNWRYEIFLKFIEKIKENKHSFYRKIRKLTW